jgi:hypothetical protein
MPIRKAPGVISKMEEANNAGLVCSGGGGVDAPILPEDA